MLELEVLEVDEMEVLLLVKLFDVLEIDVEVVLVVVTVVLV